MCLTAQMTNWLFGLMSNNDFHLKLLFQRIPLYATAYLFHFLCIPSAPILLFSFRTKKIIHWKKRNNHIYSVSLLLFLLLKSSSVSSASWRHWCRQPPPALLPVSATQIAWWWTAGAGVSPRCLPFTSCPRGAAPSCSPTTSLPCWELLPSLTCPLWRSAAHCLLSIYFSFAWQLNMLYELSRCCLPWCAQHVLHWPHTLNFPQDNNSYCMVSVMLNKLQTTSALCLKS